MDLAPTPDARAARLERSFWWIFAVIGVGSFLGPLSGSIVNVALPAIAGGYGVDVQSVKWVVLGYLMVATILLPVAGKLGQRFGEGRIYTLGFAIYALGSVACALAAQGTLTALVVARMLQAGGSALMFAVGSALVTHYVPTHRRGLAFGLIGSIVGIALVSGPVLGGLIAGVLSWPWIFWLLTPVSLAGLALALALLPPQPGGVGDAPALSALAWALLIVGLALIGEAYSLGLWVERLPLTAGLTALALIGFIVSERYGQRLFDYSIFRHNAYRLGAGAAVMLHTALFTMYIFLPFYLEGYRGLDLVHVGMLIAINPLIGILIGPGAGHLADRVGVRPLLFPGIALMVAGYAVLAWVVSSEGSLELVVVSMALSGLGGALMSGPMFAAMMSSVAPHQRAMASSFGSLTRNLGFFVGTSLGAIGLGLLLWGFGGRELMLLARTHELTEVVPPPAFNFAFSGLLVGCAALTAVAMLIALRFPNRAQYVEPARLPPGVAAEAEA